MTQRRKATYEDVLRAPRHMVAEIIAGELRLLPRPAKPHAAATTALGEELGPPFKRGRGGPGGWIILFEPELHLGDDILVPDLAGWRRTRLPVLTDDEAFFTLAPDWACEVLSSSTAKSDRSDKLPIYLREGVNHVWLVDPILRTLEILEGPAPPGRSLRFIATTRVSARSPSTRSSSISRCCGLTSRRSEARRDSGRRLLVHGCRSRFRMTSELSRLAVVERFAAAC